MMRPICVTSQVTEIRASVEKRQQVEAKLFSFDLHGDVTVLACTPDALQPRAELPVPLRHPTLLLPLAMIIFC